MQYLFSYNLVFFLKKKKLFCICILSEISGFLQHILPLSTGSSFYVSIFNVYLLKSHLLASFGLFYGQKNEMNFMRKRACLVHSLDDHFSCHYYCF